MSDPNPPDRPCLEIRKYPNRRYYDSTRSRHLTLEEIHRAILQGHDIRVTDSRSGEDLTAKVLAQIILSHDAPKLDVFSTEMLHRLIRANEQLVTDFIQKYLNQALNAFLQSQRQFEHYMRQAMGVGGPMGEPAAWARSMMAPLSSLFQPPDPSAGPPASAEPGRGSTSGAAAKPPGQTEPTPAELGQTVAELKDQVAELRRALGRRERRRPRRG